MTHGPGRSTSVLAAVTLPATLALLVTRCSAAPAPVAVAPPPPAPSASTPVSPVAVAIAPEGPRARVLLSPPEMGPDAAILPIAPDPPPLVERGQWVYDLRYASGDLYLLGIHHLDLPEARSTPRAMGRFAIELYTGPTLLERVRFDFPMLGGPPATKSDAGKAIPLHGGTFSFTKKINTRIGVMFPATSRGTRLSIWDRATNRRWPLPWPPVEMTAESLPDSGTDDPSPGVGAPGVPGEDRFGPRP